MSDPTPMSREQEPRIVDELAVLDLDRTLLNTSRITELVFAGLARQGIGAEYISEAMAYVEAQSGNSFFLFDYIEKEFSSDMLLAVEQDIKTYLLLDELKPDLLCPGADRLIYALEAQGTPCVILTYGEATYQEFKIDLFRQLIGKTTAELPAIITDTKNKSAWAVNEWFSNDNEFGEIAPEVVSEPLFVRTVTVVDDKIGNLQSPDKRVGGILVDNRTASAPGVVSTAELADAVASGIRLAEIAQL